MHLFCFLSQWLYLRITLLFCGVNNTAGSYSKMFKQVNKAQGPRKDSFAKKNFWRKGEGGLCLLGEGGRGLYVSVLSTLFTSVLSVSGSHVVIPSSGLVVTSCKETVSTDISSLPPHRKRWLLLNILNCFNPIWKDTYYGYV